MSSLLSPACVSNKASIQCPFLFSQPLDSLAFCMRTKAQEAEALLGLQATDQEYKNKMDELKVAPVEASLLSIRIKLLAQFPISESAMAETNCLL